VRERGFALPHAKEAGHFRKTALAALRLNWMLPHGKTMR
jgi:mannitol/fructose-specific phosphotransferase system IIA component (Ntr-type)